jgi:hypothetical protein
MRLHGLPQMRSGRNAQMRLRRLEPGSVVLFIRRGAGEQVDLQGELLSAVPANCSDSMLEIIHLDRSKIFIAKWSIAVPGNRDPLRVEQRPA